MQKSVRKFYGIMAVITSVFWSLTASAEMVQFQAVFMIDGKTSFNPGDTVIINGTGFGNVQVGDQFIVDFILDTSLTDSNNTTEHNDNVILEADSRIGNFGSVLNALSITAQSGNSGTFDPSAINYSTSTASTTADAVAVYKANNAIANKEAIRFLSAVAPTPGVLGGELTDVVLNFLNAQPLGVSNPEDYLEDRSVTTSPFDFNMLFLGPSQIAGNVRDLVLMDDDIQSTGFAVTNLNRPLALRFGEAEVLPATGPSFQQSIYVWGTFVSLSLPPVPPLIPPHVPGPTPIATPTATPIAVPQLAAATAVPIPAMVSILLVLALGFVGLRRQS